MTEAGSRTPPTPATAEHLHVVAEHVSPPSASNEVIVAVAAAVAVLGGVAFAAGLLLGAPLEFYGSALALGLLAMGVAVRRYFVDRFADVEAIEERPAPGVEVTPLADVRPVPRRRFLGRLVAGAAGVLGLGLLAPVVSLGPTPTDEFRRTPWASGRRLLTNDGEPIAPEDLVPGSVLTAWPEGAIGAEIAAVAVLRLREGEPAPPTNPDWVVDGNVVAYSKVCTHAGCPVALFRERDDALFCPCHQSTFDVRRGAVPVFGPAARALPQLPLGVDEEGALVATGDFVEPVGPPVG